MIGGRGRPSVRFPRSADRLPRRLLELPQTDLIIRTRLVEGHERLPCIPLHVEQLEQARAALAERELRNVLQSLDLADGVSASKRTHPAQNKSSSGARLRAYTILTGSDDVRRSPHRTTTTSRRAASPARNPTGNDARACARVHQSLESLFPEGPHYSHAHRLVALTGCSIVMSVFLIDVFRDEREMLSPRVTAGQTPEVTRNLVSSMAASLLRP